MIRLFRLAAGAVTLLGLALSWGYGPASLSPDYASRALVYLGYFTVVTNYAVAAAWLLPVLAPSTAAGRFLDRSGPRTALLACLIVVTSVYYGLLSHLWNPVGFGYVSEKILHAVSPLLFALDWLFVVPRGRVAWSTALTVLAFPAAYLVWVLALGMATGWYPYPFLHLGTIGPVALALNCLGLGALFVVVTAACIALDRLLSRRGGPGPVP